jgi:hypothetical protein
MAAAMALLFAAPLATSPVQAAEAHGAAASSVAERAAVTADYARWRRRGYYRRHYYRPRFYHRRYYRPRAFYRPYRYYRPYGYRRYYW